MILVLWYVSLWVFVIEKRKEESTSKQHPMGEKPLEVFKFQNTQIYVTNIGTKNIRIEVAFFSI